MSARLPGAERRRRVLEQAIGVFAERGFSGTRTSDLAKACGVSDAMLFKLFGSKQGLYRAMIEWKLARSGEGVFPLEAAARGDDRAVLETVGREILRNTLSDPAFLRLLLYSALERHPLARMFQESRSRKVVAFLSKYLQGRMRAGALRRADPELAALSFLGSVFQYALAVEVFGLTRRRRDPDAVARAAAETALEGLRRRA